jgi:hypothetical protein
MFLPSPHSSPDQTFEASHAPLAKVHHILLPPSHTTYNYQKVSPFVTYRKNINTSSQGEYSKPRNLHGAMNLHIQNPSKSQAFLVTSKQKASIVFSIVGNASMLMTYSTN